LLPFKNKTIIISTQSSLTKSKLRRQHQHINQQQALTKLTVKLENQHFLQLEMQERNHTPPHSSENVIKLNQNEKS